jgi:hypothetical protein
VAKARAEDFKARKDQSTAKRMPKVSFPYLAFLDTEWTIAPKNTLLTASLPAKFRHRDPEQADHHKRFPGDGLHSSHAGLRLHSND